MKSLRKLVGGDRLLGTLPDHEIERLANDGQLITENFSPGGLKQACYELRAGSIFYYPLVSDERQLVPDGGYIPVKPRQTIVIISMESFSLPSDVLARIMTKGQL